jgi:hypothetical protein
VLGHRLSSPLVKQSDIINLICKGSLTGFVLVRGGYETAKDLEPVQFGFIHQRCKVNPTELGYFNFFQASEMARCELESQGKKMNVDFNVIDLKFHALEILKRLTEKKITLSRRSLHQEGELLGTGYFKFLIQERRFLQF